MPSRVVQSRPAAAAPSAGLHHGVFRPRNSPVLRYRDKPLNPLLASYLMSSRWLPLTVEGHAAKTKGEEQLSKYSVHKKKKKMDVVYAASS